MSDPLSIYVSAAGRRVELMRCFREAAGVLGLDIRIIAGDLNPEFSAACQEADVAIRTPRCDAPDFLPAVVDACKAHGVRMIVPTIDPELIVYSRAIDDLARLGIVASVSRPNVIDLARSKLRTAHWLRDHGVRTPDTASIEMLRNSPDSIGWPLILKPDAGSASQGIYVAQSLNDLRSDSGQAYIAQALLRGTEYTTNIFFDEHGTLRAAVPHIRHEVRGGEVSKGETVRVPALIAAAEALGRHLSGARGALCFQSIITDDGAAWIFEINARFGGGYPLAHRAGAPFAQWLLAEVAGVPVDYRHEWRAGVRMLRYDAARFIDQLQDNEKPPA